MCKARYLVSLLLVMVMIVAGCGSDGGGGTSTPLGELNVINHASNSYDIIELYFSLSSDPSWGDERLGGGVLLPGEVYWDNIPAGTYDVLVVFEDAEEDFVFGLVIDEGLPTNWIAYYPAAADDNYEENDTLGTAYDLSWDEATWLTNVLGYGVQSDDDWFEVYVNPSQLRLLVDLVFTHADGDIDIQLYDDTGTLVTGSYSMTDDELIDIEVSSGGYYYLRVYYDDAGNSYNLWWASLTP